MENRMIKLAIISLLASIYTFARAETPQMITELKANDALSMLGRKNFETELFLNGSDVTSFYVDQTEVEKKATESEQEYLQRMQNRQQQQQQFCQQMQPNGYQPEYLQGCEGKRIIYKQKLSTENSQISFHSKSTTSTFVFSKEQNAILAYASPSYLTCNIVFVRRYSYPNPSYQEQTMYYTDEASFNACMSNGGNEQTCKNFAKRSMGAQPRQYDQTGSGYWQVLAGSCKVMGQFLPQQQQPNGE